MALGGCYSILKFFLVVFNLFFWLLGIAGIIFAVWMLIDPTFTFSLTQAPTDYLISIIIILIASILMVIVAGMGIYGALKESHCALMTFFSFLLIIFVAELSAGLWAYLNSHSLEQQVRNAVRLTVTEEYQQNDNRRLLFDTFQRNLHCCGADKPTDWIGNQQIINMGITTEPTVYNIPESCCKMGRSQEECFKATHNLKVTSPINYNVIYDRGCYNLIISQLREHTFIVMAFGFGIATLQILALLFSLILAFAVKRSNRYKA